MEELVETVVWINFGFWPFGGIEDGLGEGSLGYGEVLFGSGAANRGYAAETVVISGEMGGGGAGEWVCLLMRGW